MRQPEGQPNSGKDTLINKARRLGYSIGDKFRINNNSQLATATEGTGSLSNPLATEDPKKSGLFEQRKLRPLHATAGVGTAGTATRRDGETKPGISKRLKLVLAGTATAAILGGSYGIYQANQTEKPAEVTGISEPAPFVPRFESENWINLPPSEIKQLAKVPPVQPIDPEQYLSTVSPALQEKAREAGYTIIYQGDPTDTTGRTVVAGERQQPTEGGYKYTNLKSFEDQGFGDNGRTVTGVFEGWAAKPEDQNEIYAVMINPLTKEKYIININLSPSDTDRGMATRFIVDDLNYGPDEVLKMRINGGEWTPTIFLPDNPSKMEGSSARNSYRQHTDFPKFYDLLTENKTIPDNLVKQGDVVTAFYPVGAGSKSQAKSTDENGAYFGGLFVVRNIGGTPIREIPIQNPSQDNPKK